MSVWLCDACCPLRGACVRPRGEGRPLWVPQHKPYVSASASTGSARARWPSEVATVGRSGNGPRRRSGPAQSGPCQPLSCLSTTPLPQNASHLGPRIGHGLGDMVRSGSHVEQQGQEQAGLAGVEPSAADHSPGSQVCL